MWQVGYMAANDSRIDGCTDAGARVAVSASLSLSLCLFACLPASLPVSV
jgi:hypothetical protein